MTNPRKAVRRLGRADCGASSSLTDGKPSAAQASSSAAKRSLGSSRSECSSAPICSSVSLIDGPPQLFDHPVQPGAGIRLARVGYRGDLRVGEAGEELQDDELPLAGGQ